MDDATSKTCSKCGEGKPLDAFSPNRRLRSGRQSSCRDCAARYRAANRDKVRASQRKYQAANREKINARARERHDPETSRTYYQDNHSRIREQQRQYRKANAEAKKARDAAYREANREQILTYQAAYREAHRQEYRRKAREWMKANPERVAEIQRRRRARKRNATVGPVDLDALWTGVCGICGDLLDRSLKRPNPKSPSIDHIIPLALGGSHTQENLRWTCLVCNFRKGPRLDP